MKWSDVGGAIADAAPVLGTALGGPAGGAVGSILSSLFGSEKTPEAVNKAIKNDPDAYVKLKKLEQDHSRELKRIVLESEASRLESVNKTIRAETKAEDKYVRRWRPTYGYITALAWLLQTAGIVFVFIYTALHPSEHSADILGNTTQLVGSLSVMWGIALSILGVSVHKRSEDKKLMAGLKPKSLLNRILGEKSVED